MEHGPLIQQAIDAKETSKKLVREREQIRKACERRQQVKRSDRPLLWFSHHEE